jgi:hypothetical protein
MRFSDVAALVGQTLTVKLESLRVECVVHDCKWVYGSVRLLVEPVRGSGRQWVDRGRVDDSNSRQVRS